MRVHIVHRGSSCCDLVVRGYLDDEALEYDEGFVFEFRGGL
jgi:hypothetical protein